MPIKKRGGLDLGEDMTGIPKGKNYLLAIAINAYHHAPKLNNCVGDAEAIIDVLVNKYDFDKDNVTCLFDDAATRENIDENLRALAAKITKEDNLLIYFAGHGAFDEIGRTGGYLIPVEAKRGKFSTFFSNVNLLNLIKAIESFHTFLLMDSCFSGSLFSLLRGNSTTLAENVERFPSRWGLAAGRIEKVADGWHGDNSPFAKAVLQYLKTNTNAKFPASELVQYTKRVTPRNAKQTPVGGPLYKVGDMDGEFVFHLKKDEAADWHTAVITDTVTAYQVYLTTYPDGKHIAAATIAIKKLSAATLWQKIENASDKNAYQIGQKVQLIETFIANHATETHYRQVLQEGKKMRWKKKFIAASTDRYDLLDFIAENPPFFAAEAQQLIAKFEKAAITPKTYAKNPSEKATGVTASKIKSNTPKAQRKPHKKAKPSSSTHNSTAKSPLLTRSWVKRIGMAILVLLLIVVIWKVMPPIGNTTDDDSTGLVDSTETAIVDIETPATKAAKDYLSLRNEGDAYAKSKKYADAKVKYKKALAIAKDFDFDTSKAEAGIKKCDIELKKIADGQSKKEKEKQYANWKTKGDAAYKRANYTGALDYYETAANYIDDSIIKKKIKASQDKIKAADKAIQKQKNYQTNLKAGDKYYKAKRYEKAKTAYLKAQNDDNTSIIQNKIADCEEKLKPPKPKLPTIIANIAKNMKKISGDTFTMGCTSEQGGDCYDSEKPSHKVTLNSYQVNKYEVTQEEWRAVMGSDPSGLKFKGCDKCPVENVSWNDIQEFLKKLNKKTGKHYRLPTEAEWEYAARGGQHYKYAGSNTIGNVAWYSGNSNSKTHAVGGKKANGYGLYDMSGNVYEWCSDWYGDYASGAQTNPKGAGKGADRVSRGGSWNNDARHCRVSHRDYWNPRSRHSYLGFRLAHSSR